MGKRSSGIITVALSAALAAALVAGPAAGAVRGTWPQTLHKIQGVSGGYAGYKNGPADIPGATPPESSANQIGKLQVPKGHFVAFAKLTLENDASGARFIVCRTAAEGDFDTSAATVAPNSQSTISMNVVHSFTSAGEFDVTCSDSTGTTTDTKFFNLKITAIEVPVLQNSAI
ncbi:MAG: hypothetical protein ABR579_03820 [Actinomycetota bacterium]